MSESGDWKELHDRIFGKEKVVWENDYYQFVSDHWSRTVTKHMREMDIHGIELRGWTAYKLVPKTEDGLTGYIIYDEKGQPYCDFDSAEGALYWVDAYKYTKSFDNDIVTMVERRNAGERHRRTDIGTGIRMRYVESRRFQWAGRARIEREVRVRIILPYNADREGDNIRKGIGGNGSPRMPEHGRIQANVIR